jgi:hypothetical protein
LINALWASLMGRLRARLKDCLHDSLQISA